MKTTKKNCEICSKTFYKKESESVKYFATKKFCSNNCRIKSLGGIRLSDEQKIRNCKVCNKVINKPDVASSVWLNSYRCCSAECYRKDNEYWDKREKSIEKCQQGLKKFFECGGRLAAWEKGKVVSKEQRIKISATLQGVSLEKWSGFSKKENLRDRRRFADTIQKQVLERDNYTCQMCGERNGYHHVDHIQPWSEYVEGRFSMDNCRTLCVACHYLVTFGREMPKNSNWGVKSYKVKVASEM